MKVVKKLLKVLLWIAAILVVALLTLPLWFGPVVKTTANLVVPRVIQADFHLGHLYLNPYTARFELGDLQLGNPEGYSEKFAATVGELAFDADVLSLLTDTIHVEEIAVKDVFASYVYGGQNGVDNFKQMQYNVAGGKEKYEAAQEKAAADLAEEPVEQPAEQPAEEKPGKKVVIDRLEISGLLVQYRILPIRVPSFTLTDIGKDSGGATLEDLWQQICEGVLKASGAIGDQLNALGGQANEALGQAADAAGKAVDSASKALDSMTKGGSDAVNKAADSASKALDSIKSLW